MRIVQEDINKHTKGKEVIELGCNDGALEETTDCIKYTGVDLYSKTPKVVKEDAFEFLEKQEDKSLDVVMAKCSMQFFDWTKLHDVLSRKLKPDGAGLFYDISEQTSFWGNETFNKHFMYKYAYTDAPIAYVLEAKYQISEDQARAMATNRIWSTHQHLSN